MDKPLLGIGLFVLAVICFGSGDVLTKLASQVLPPTEIAWIRFLLFTVAAAIIDARSGPGHFRVRRPVLQLLRGVGLVASALFTIMALKRLPLAETTTLSFMSPLLITMLSIPVLGEVVGPRRWVAVVVGLIGVIVVARPGTAAFQVAALFVFASSAAWAVTSVITRKIAFAERATTTVLWTAASGLVVLSLLLPLEAVWPTRQGLLLALGLGVVSSASQYFMLLAYRYAPASLLAPFSYLQLLLATVYGWLVFGVWPDRWTLLGAAIIAGSGLVLASGERTRRIPPPRQTA